MRVAVLDDDQQVALELGPWAELGTDVAFFADAVEDIAAFRRGAPVRVLTGSRSTA